MIRMQHLQALYLKMIELHESATNGISYSLLRFAFKEISRDFTLQKRHRQNPICRQLPIDVRHSHVRKARQGFAKKIRIFSFMDVIRFFQEASADLFDKSAGRMAR